MDSRKTRSQVTKQALMRAAESLIAQHGLVGISIREIVTRAGQKNESALQYHFGSLQGLVDAIHAERAEQIRAMRGQLIQALLAGGEQPTLRQICTLVVLPAYELARQDEEFRTYVRAFGHELAVREDSVLSRVVSLGAGGSGGEKMFEMLKQALPDLEPELYNLRMEAAIRHCAASIYAHARQPQSLDSRASQLFINNLVDTVEGLLSAPVAPETRQSLPAIT